MRGMAGNRNIIIAVLVSLAVHVFFMTAVILVNPAMGMKIKAYTEVDFLGPLLKKTAFDIMLENASPLLRTSYSRRRDPSLPDLLKAVSPKRHIWREYELQDQGVREDDRVNDYLADKKTIPGFLLKTIEGRGTRAEGRVEGRLVMHKPVMLKTDLNRFGDEDLYTFKAKVLVSAEGSVRSIVPATTTGDPQIDQKLVEYVKKWIFEPEKGSDADSWEDIAIEMTKEGV